METGLRSLFAIRHSPFAIHPSLFASRLLALGITAVCAALFVAGCLPAAVTTEGSSQGERSLASIRVGFTGSADVADIPSLLAFDLLAERGYGVEPIFFSKTELSAAALAKGDIQFANGSTRTIWAAIAKGAEIVTIMEQSANIWVLASTPDIRACADLHDKRVAISSPGSLNATLLDAYIQLSCPGIEPRIILIEGTEGRTAALMVGEIDAAPLETSDFLRVERQKPGRFHRLVDYSTTMPALKTTGVHVNRAFATQHPDVVKDYLEAMLTVHRRIADKPDLLEAAVAKHLGSSREEASELVTAYLSARIWDANGGMDRESIVQSIDFYARMGSLPPGLAEADAADLTYLNQVLARIGRR